jgi:hypothetical protein
VPLVVIFFQHLARTLILRQHSHAVHRQRFDLSDFTRELLNLEGSLGTLTERIQRFDARKRENDPGPITVAVGRGVPARLTRAAPKKGKRKGTD